MRKIFLLLIVISFTSCSESRMVKDFGGTMTINLPKGQKLINVTWKSEYDIWYLTKPMVESDSPQTYTFIQNKGDIISITGNGKVILVESK